VGKGLPAGRIDSSILETIDYEYQKRAINVEHSFSEFTCLCPYSDLPDFANIIIVYTPYKKCVELKSLKFYLYSYRQVRIYHEHVVNKILEDLVSLLSPRYMKVIAEFNVRGGILTATEAEYKKK